MTGTPLDLTPFGGIVSALGWLYWVLTAGLIGLALWLPKRGVMKLVAAALMLGVVVYPIFLRPVQKEIEAQLELQARLDAAVAHFEMRCKTAGETIKQTVQNVDGVVWMKWRTHDVKDVYDQFKLFDPFGRDCWGEDCIERLLTLPEQNGRFEREVKQRKGRFRWVESTDPADGQVYRYAGVMTPRPMWTPAAIERYRQKTGLELDDDSYWFKTERRPLQRFTARYAITWDDISTREDREHWIAGGSLKVIDLKTNEVIAERVGYMMDRGLGNRGGHRQPWAFAEQYACPEFQKIGPSDDRRSRGAEGRFFVVRVLNSTGSN